MTPETPNLISRANIFVLEQNFPRKLYQGHKPIKETPYSSGLTL